MILHWNILLLKKIISILMDSSVLFPFLLTLKFTHISYNFIVRIMGNTAIYWTFRTWSSQHYISLYQLDSQGDHLTIWQSFQVLRGVLLNNQISTLLLWLFDMHYSSFPRLVTYSTSSVQFSHSFVSDSLRPHEPQHARLPCPSPTPRVYTNSCLLCQGFHPTISSSVTPSTPALSLSHHQDLFKWVSSSHQVTKVL